MTGQFAPHAEAAVDRDRAFVQWLEQRCVTLRRVAPGVVHNGDLTRRDAVRRR